ncbi:MAG TPA: GNAT family protein [Vicinamibacterales bacterium]|jgi:RimJ/RimL family protein N-acetyltransferase
MELLTLDAPEHFQLAARWLAQKENYQWLEFSDGRQQVSPEWLKISIQRRSLVVRLFTTDADRTPIGIVALGNINPHFKTANIWVVVGDKSYVVRGYATRAASRMLTLGFKELGLQAIHTWIVEHNPSIKITKRLKFRLIGRQRQCHCIDGQMYDRLWFDLLHSEHQETLDVPQQRSA